ncbi:hypothetical protein SAMN05192559_107211 [Halobacillus karajensis]|uniref:hypothetical protein n=1 Tax=Halobacillus karajensis TaxID=195088 RepID=UPI0008A7C031|nr:hypothetical protein [Halobacillus karajensis]SEI02520.1 hypothetical protein SAMN05192559_107211 [Halobacillus karajensis]
MYKVLAYVLAISLVVIAAGAYVINDYLFSETTSSAQEEVNQEEEIENMRKNGGLVSSEEQEKFKEEGLNPFGDNVSKDDLMLKNIFMG